MFVQVVKKQRAGRAKSVVFHLLIGLIAVAGIYRCA